MNRFRDNRGMTLLELIVAIAIGSIITLAATTLLLLGLRIYKQSNETITRQNQVRVGMTVIEELVAENPVIGAGEGKVLTTEDGELLSYDADRKVLLTAAGAQIMKEIDGFEASFDDNLDLLTIRLETGGETYTASIFCRVAPQPVTEGSAVAASAEPTTEEILNAAISDKDAAPNVRAFLKTLASQMGSTGQILTEEGEGEYYSQWYIGSFEDNPGWSEETPWCACFVSWALEECSGYLKGQIPRFANVDSFWAEFVTTDSWKTEDPEAGDIVFFDWIVDAEKNAQHVGVVLAVEDGWIYTIEGNSNGRVAVCRYASIDERIMGYGVLNWT